MTRPRWYDEGLRFGCTSCGTCCKGPMPGYVYVTEEEIGRLVDHLETTLASFGRRYLREVEDGRLALTEQGNFDCVFWEDDRGCTVYRSRPGQCRQFPFWPEVLESKRAWREEASSCPGMNKGKLYTLEEIQRIAAGKRGTRSGRRRRARRLA